MGQQRHEWLRQSAELMNAGISQNRAARLLGVSSANLTRWRNAFLLGGMEALEDQRAGKCGRKPLVTLNEDEQAEARRLFVMTESKTTALRMLASRPETRPEVAEAINKRRSSKHTITRTLRDQVDVPAQVIGFHKSPKQVRVNAFVCPRTLTYIDALGTERRLEPGDLSERDDMSNNFLCWVPWPWGGDPCSDRYGVRVARGQNLIKIDVASLFFTSFNFLIRLRDSYRADDIWQWIGQTYRDIGLPRIGERWERGTWASKRLRGDKDVPIEAGHTPEDVRLGGMAALGLKVIVSQSPTTKIIENRFNFLQRAMCDIPGQIGRSRGEMEREQKLWTACRMGHQDPRQYFLSFDQACDEIEKRLHWVNSEPVEGLLYRGVPAEKWQTGLIANPLKALPAEKAWLFSRDRREITVAKGNVLVRYTTPDGHRAAWSFFHPDLWRHDRKKVAVYFDHYAPAMGATLVISEGKDAGLVLPAELVEGCPQFALGFQTGEETGAADAMLSALDRKGGFMDAVRSEYRALGIGGRRLARVSRAEDGMGREAKIDSTAPRDSSANLSGAPAQTPPTRRQPLVVDFDEAAELARLDALDADARARGHLLPV